MNQLESVVELVVLWEPGQHQSRICLTDSVPRLKALQQKAGPSTCPRKGHDTAEWNVCSYSLALSFLPFLPLHSLSHTHIHNTYIRVHTRTLRVRNLRCYCNVIAHGTYGAFPEPGTFLPFDKSSGCPCFASWTFLHRKTSRDFFSLLVSQMRKKQIRSCVAVFLV